MGWLRPQSMSLLNQLLLHKVGCVVFVGPFLLLLLQYIFALSFSRIFRGMCLYFVTDHIFGLLPAVRVSINDHS